MPDATKQERIEALSAKLLALLNAPVPVTPTCTISKSRFTAGLQCAKREYLQVHHPELANSVDEAAKQQGTEVGLLARRAFPGGVLVNSDREHLADAIRQTRELVSNHEIPAIYEATFQHNGVLVRVDVLERCGATFRLIEVKSSTDMKAHYAHDIGIQKYVIEGAGLHVSGTYLMHLNRRYVYDGQTDEHGRRQYDLSRLFLLRSVQPTSAAVISRELNQQFKVLADANPPEIEPGAQCTKPYECEFFKFCNQVWPADDLRSLPLQKWKIEALRNRGFFSLDQLPDPFTLRFIFHLTERECRIASAAKCGKMQVRGDLAAELAVLRHPICYFDSETVWPALPRYAGMHPYDHVPFQWSMELQQYPGSLFQHHEFLWECDSDPRGAFAKSLCDAVAEVKSVIVYNQSFERLRLAELAQAFPQHRTALIDAQGKLWDLLPAIRRHVYHPAFQKTFSLKTVLPTLVPAMSYDSLEILNGSQAGLAWMRLLVASDDSQRQRIKRALLQYCGRDTLGLAYIMEVLRQLANSSRAGLP